MNVGLCLLTLFSVSSSLPMSNQGYSNFSFNATECPSWYISRQDGCTCGKSLGPLVRCRKNERVSVRIAYCMSYDNTTGQVLVGNCPYVKPHKQRVRSYVVQPKNVSDLNSRLCGWANRTGFLCSRCKEGLGVSVMTYDNKCVECIGKWKGWILYLFLAILPTTLFFIFVISCKIRSTSGYLNSLVALSQVITFYVDKYPNTILRYNGISRSVLLGMATIAGIWNLDFFRLLIPHFCISENMTTLNIIAMEYIVASYPLLLIVVLYIFIELYDRDFKPFQILWAPFKCVLSSMNWNIDIRHSLIDAFATFLHLSYTKLIFVSFNLISYVATYNSKGEHVYPNVLYYAGEVPYFSKTHLPYFILSIIVLLVFVISPFLLLLFYPTKTFQKCLGLFPRVNWHPLHAFADAFNGCFKNGTDGTRDWRYFGSFYLLFRMTFYLTSVISEVTSSMILTIIPLIASLMFALCKPYKFNFFNVLDALAFALLELTQIWNVYSNYVFKIPAVVTILSAGAVFSYTFILLLYKGMSTCAPRVLERLQSKALFASVCRALVEGYNAANSVNKRDSRIDIEEVDLPDRVLNPGSYQELSVSRSLLSNSNVELPVNYGSIE